MKKLIFTLLLLVSTIVHSQEAVSNDLVVTTPDRDTMYILNNPSGRLLYRGWLNEPTAEGYTPKIFLVEALEPYRSCSLRAKCKNKRKKRRTL